MRASSVKETSEGMLMAPRSHGPQNQNPIAIRIFIPTWVSRPGLLKRSRPSTLPYLKDLPGLLGNTPKAIGDTYLQRFPPTTDRLPQGYPGLHNKQKNGQKCPFSRLSNPLITCTRYMATWRARAADAEYRVGALRSATGTLNSSALRPTREVETSLWRALMQGAASEFRYYITLLRN